jgi:hypothetical protein
MRVNYYYDLTEGDYSSDPDEGNLIKLCTACARKAAAAVDFASRGDDESRCELCGAGQGDGE